MTRCFRPAYKDRNGKKCKTSKWYIEFRDHPKLAKLIESWFMEHCGSLAEREQGAIRKLLGQKEY